MILPVVLGAILLGRAFDRYELNPTQYSIYDQNEVKKQIQVIPREYFESRFLVPTTYDEAYRFLNLDPELSIRSKSGDAKFTGYVPYLLSTFDRMNTVEILFTVQIGTENRTFPTTTQLRRDWQTKPQSEVGTHYIKSIQYGGHFIASYRIEALDSKDHELIRSEVKHYVGKSGELKQLRIRDLQTLEKSLRKVATFSLHAYATTGSLRSPTNLRELYQLAIQYPDVVKHMNEGKGHPVAIQLADLNTIQSNYPKFRKHPSLTSVIREAEEKYDDLRNAMDKYEECEEENNLYEPEEQQELNTFYVSLKKAIRAMDFAVSQLNVSRGTDQFDEAFQTYGQRTDNNRYTKELYEIQKHLVRQTPTTAERPLSKRLWSSWQNLMSKMRSP